MGNQIDRRTLLVRGGLALGSMVALPSVLASCSSSGAASASTAGSASTTLNIPFLADMQVPDPDVFYEGEGLLVTTSVYEGLIGYEPVPAGVMPAYSQSNRFVPVLAESWTVSSDGLTYTFKLRPNVTFNDGTPMNAEAWRASFARRLAVNGGPSYMVQPVASTSAPDSLTFVVTLKAPTSPFLDYLAGPWGPKAVSPTAVTKHAIGGDLAQKWLSTHSAGTGPYQISRFIPSSQYTLTGYDQYWGAKAHFSTMQIQIMPQVQTQELELQGGQLDMITKGLLVADIASFEKNSSFQVLKYPLALKTAMVINPNGIFADKALRQALRQAIDRQAVLDGSYKDTATISTQFYPVACFPTGAAADNPTYDPSQLKALVQGLSNKTVDIGAAAETGPAGLTAAQLIQVQLEAVGLNASVRSIQSSEEFSLYQAPESQQPDLLLCVQGGDVMHPDNIMRVVWRTKAGPLNYFNWSIPGLDALMDEGSKTTNFADFVQIYAQCAQMVIDEAAVLSLFDAGDAMVVRDGISGFVHVPMTEWTFQMGKLTES
jgi:peptide/nickel transport system substrate-binding protein